MCILSLRASTQQRTLVQSDLQPNHQHFLLQEISLKFKELVLWLKNVTRNPQRTITPLCVSGQNPQKRQGRGSLIETAFYQLSSRSLFCRSFCSEPHLPGWVGKQDAADSNLPICPWHPSLPSFISICTTTSVEAQRRSLLKRD